MSAHSFLMSPSNRLSSGEGDAGSGSHETDILVVTTPPSLRSSSAAASHLYSPASSTRSPFSIDPAPSPPLSPPPPRSFSSAAIASSPLARARHVLQSSSAEHNSHTSWAEHNSHTSSADTPVKLQRLTDGLHVREENEVEAEGGHNEQPQPLEQARAHDDQRPIAVPVAHSSSPVSANLHGQQRQLNILARPRPSTGGARVGGGFESSPSDSGCIQTGAAAGGALGAVPSPHIPEIWGESAATARVLLQVTRGSAPAACLSSRADSGHVSRV